MDKPDVFELTIDPCLPHASTRSSSARFASALLDDRFDDPVARRRSPASRRRSRRFGSAPARRAVKNGSGFSFRARSSPLSRRLRRDVEEQNGITGVGKMRGDLRAHRAGAEHGGDRIFW